MSNTPPRIIFDYRTDSPEQRADLIRHLKHLIAYYHGKAVIEVMAYGAGLQLLTDAAPDLGSDENEAVSNVQLLACNNTMKRLNLTSQDLVDGVHVVSSGLGHIVDRQLEGWAYIKA